MPAPRPVPKEELACLKKLLNDGLTFPAIGAVMEEKFHKWFTPNTIRHRAYAMGLRPKVRTSVRNTDAYIRVCRLRDKGVPVATIAAMLGMSYNAVADYSREWFSTNKAAKFAGFTEKQADKVALEKVGYLDIETSNLDADLGFVLSYCIQDARGKELGRALRPSEFRGRHKTLDRELIAECIKDMKKFDRLVCHYGMYFDIPFLRTRAFKYGMQDDFPKPREIVLSDTWLIARKKFKLHSNRLASVAKLFGIPAKQHPLDGEEWTGAITGDKWALDYVWKHNTEDCTTTRLVYLSEKNAMALTDASI